MKAPASAGVDACAAAALRSERVAPLEAYEFLSDRLAAEARLIFAAAAAMQWGSYDPYDLLRSPLIGWIPRFSQLAARVGVQVGLRSGTAIRRASRIPRHVEAKALSDFLSAAALLMDQGCEWPALYLDDLLARLLQCGIPTRGGVGWGLDFPYSTRFVNAPARTPNIYQTTNAIHALISVHERTGRADAAEAALSGARFIVNDLGSVRLNGLRWLRYWVGLDVGIPNVQALAASALARASKVLEQPSLGEVADQAAETACAVQEPEGFWYYESNRARFVDGFHSGFILQSLFEYRRYRGMKAIEIEPSFARGKQFFLRNFITQDGLPRYFCGGGPSVEGQNAAQCVQTLAVCAEDRNEVDTALRIWKRVHVSGGVLRAFLHSHTSVMAQWSPQFPSLRWNIGPLLLAEAHLVNALEGEGDFV